MDCLERGEKGRSFVDGSTVLGFLVIPIPLTRRGNLELAEFAYPGRERPGNLEFAQVF
jgi:hypothetical protein